MVIKKLSKKLIRKKIKNKSRRQYLGIKHYIKKLKKNSRRHYGGATNNRKKIKKNSRRHYGGSNYAENVILTPDDLQTADNNARIQRFLALLKSEPKGSTKAKRHWDIGAAKGLAIQYLNLSNYLQAYKFETRRLEKLPYDEHNKQSGNITARLNREKVLKLEMDKLYETIRKYAPTDDLMRRVFETLPPENPTQVMVGPIY